jgi:hypothetical protein
MRIPHAFFAVINPTVRLLLRSPLHQFWSGSLMLVTFTGRNSGRVFTIPVRYLQHDGKIRCFTSCTNQWWRNLRGGADVSLYVAGRSISCHAEAFAGDPTRIVPALAEFLSRFPQDAPYYDVQVDARGNPLPAQVDQASLQTVMVEATPN